MATTNFTSADVQTRKAWSERVYEDITTDTELVSEAISDGILKLKDDLSRGAGDQVKYHFIRRTNDKGFIDDATATGNEKALVYDQDTIDIHELRQVIQVPTTGTISAQRVTFKMPEDAYMNLKNYIQERMIVGMLNQLAGNDASSYTYDGVTFSTATELLEITGMNTVTAPSSNQHIFAGTGNSTDTNVGADTAATFSFALIDEAEARARKNRPYVRQLEKGGIKYRCYLHVDGFKQLIQDTSAPIQFRDIYLNKMAGNQDDELFGTKYQYSQTEIVVTDKVPYGATSQTTESNVRRAVFVGQEAGCIAFGKGFEAKGVTTPGFKFEDDYVDINKWQRIAICSLFGIGKSSYNGVDRGTVAISHYVA